MKLKRKPNLPPPRTEKISLDSSTTSALDQYMRYYQATYNQAIAADELIVEILIEFFRNDREFQKWLRTQKDTSEPTKKESTKPEASKQTYQSSEQATTAAEPEK